MTARASRRAAAFDFASLTPTECLLIAQAAHERGTAPTVWSAVSKLMARHALVSRPKNFFTPTLCGSIYEHLMREAGLEMSDAASLPKARENLSLAQKHFQIRFDELVTLIQAEEATFRTLLKEIEEIRAGRWDTSLGARLAGSSSSEAATVGDDQPNESENIKSPEADNRHKQEEEGHNDCQGHQEKEDDERGVQAELENKASPSSAHIDVSVEEVEDIQVDGNAEDEGEPEELAYPNEPPLSSEPPAPSKSVEQQDDGESSADEPLQTIRRSTRRKSSAASNAPPMQSSRVSRTRRQRQIQEPDSVGSETETDTAAKGRTPQMDEDFPASPYESASARTREGKRKASFPDETIKDPKRLRADSEFPDDEESSHISHSTRSRPNRQGVRTGEQVPNKKFQNVIGLLHQQLSAHRNGTIFHNPIKLSDAPDYLDIVKRPMDLKTIKARVKDGAISSSQEFQRDAYVMFANAMMYNRPGSDVYTMAEDMMLDSEMQIMNFKQTEGFRAQR